MKRLLILLSALLLCFSLSAQWSDFVYESDVDTPESSWSIIRTAFDSTGRLYLANSTGKVWYTDNPLDAEPAYTELMDRTLSNGIQGIAIDADNNVYLSGDNSPDGFIAKYDSSGTEVWAQVLAGKRVTGCAILSSGELLVTSFGGLFYVFDVDDPMKYEIVDTFDATDPGWGAVEAGGRTDYTFAREVDIDTEGYVVPAGSNGLALKTEVNTADGVLGTVYAEIGEETWTDYSVTWRQLVDNDSGTGTSEYAGVGIRTDGFRSVGGDGYYIEVRTDHSGALGSHASLASAKDGYIARFWFELGTSSIEAQGYTEGVDGFVVNINPDPLGDPISHIGEWVDYKLEAIGGTINVYIHDLVTPVFSFVDPAPIEAGKVGVMHWDPWASLATGVYSYIDVLKIEGPKVLTPGLANFVRDIAITPADDIFAIQSGAVKKVTGGALGQFSAAAFGDAAYLDMSWNVRPTVAYDADLNAVFSSNFDIGPPVTAGKVFIQNADDGSLLQTIDDFPYADFQASAVAVTEVGAAKAALISGFRDVMRLYKVEEIEVKDWQLYTY